MAEMRSRSELPVQCWLTPDWNLDGLAGVVTTTRQGAFSEGVYAGFNLALHVDDDPRGVSANRARLLEHYQSAGLRRIQWLNQVHGVDVLTADERSAQGTPEADAAWTDQPGLGLAVLTADCLPVVVVARDGSSVGIAHGGWRGLVNGVLANLLAALKPADTGYQAWIGPGIGVSAYEVGEDVARQVRACGDFQVLQPGQAAGKYQLDLAELALQQLRALGIEDVHLAGTCTVANPVCYSYRRDGVTGRMATLVWLRSEDPMTGSA